jgi:hypothetical protein
MSVKFPSLHLLFRHFFAFLLVVIFCVSVSPVSRVPTLEAPSFFHQLVLFVDHQSVDVHRIWISFFSREVVFLLRGSLCPGVSSSSFYCPVHLVEPVVNHCCPFVPIINGLEWGFESHQLECQTPGQCLLKQFHG